MRLLWIIPVASLLASCVASDTADTGAVKVAATIYPLAHFSSQVGGDLVTVTQVTPDGVEPHEYEPTARDIADILKADVLVVNGAGVDEWVEKLVPEFRAKGGAVVRMSDEIAMRATEETEEEHEEEGHDHEGGLDPHAWLDPTLVMDEVGALRRTLIARDPDNEETYKKNAARFMDQLEGLHRSFEAGLRECDGREIIVAHDAFGYLAARYGLTAHAIAGLSPDEEPSPRQMAEIASLGERKGIGTIFFETLTSPRLAETIAREYASKTAVLNPLEGLSSAEKEAGATYVSVMERNLSALRTALNCR